MRGIVNERYWNLIRKINYIEGIIIVPLCDHNNPRYQFDPGDYDFERAASYKMSIQRWKEKRLFKIYGFFKCEVLSLEGGYASNPSSLGLVKQYIIDEWSFLITVRGAKENLEKFKEVLLKYDIETTLVYEKDTSPGFSSFLSSFFLKNAKNIAYCLAGVIPRVVAFPIQWEKASLKLKDLANQHSCILEVKSISSFEIERGYVNVAHESIIIGAIPVPQECYDKQYIYPLEKLQNPL
ncbi:hypothetical protein H6F90_17075 [Trichocoleus sp. FACHB-591]|uniref:hypothetical protein n=1 Tax=Trichocoleus sp. FACHB-591 TaxID=2692872 RepID=UPI0016866D2F|nr:hypothetical protein [Trichocoleus sp. FACHB-591]MBD2096818.1 hypothetical protein [Trichocoleus sp. FACHB-591]